MVNSRSLSGRQQEILAMAAEGRTDKEIALATGLSLGTLRTYWDRLRRRFDARSRAEVVAKALVAPLNDHRSYVLRKLPLFIWTMDASGKLEFCNDWFLSRGGVSGEEALRVGFRSLMAESDIESLEAQWLQARVTGNGYEALVNLRCGREQAPVLHKIRLIPLRGPEGSVSKWIGYCRELAENADDQMLHFLKAMLL